MESKNEPKEMSNDKAKTMAERFPLNIPQEVFDGWQLNWKTGDSKILMRELKLSRPIIDRALKYGNVRKPSTQAKITQFFKNRLAREKTNGINLTIKTKGEDNDKVDA